MQNRKQGGGILKWNTPDIYARVSKNNFQTFQNVYICNRKNGPGRRVPVSEKPRFFRFSRKTRCNYFEKMSAVFDTHKPPIYSSRFLGLAETRCGIPRYPGNGSPRKNAHVDLVRPSREIRKRKNRVRARIRGIWLKNPPLIRNDPLIRGGFLKLGGFL